MSRVCAFCLLPVLLPLALGCGDASEDAVADDDSYPDGSSDARADGAASKDARHEGCSAGKQLCAGSCVDTATNASHCGGCGKSCEGGAQCHAGACGPPSCAAPCSKQGAKECSGEGLRECLPHASIPGCLEWSPVEPCATGSVCDPKTATCREVCGDSCEPFSVILLPDTQGYTYHKDGEQGSKTYKKQTQWIVDHRKSDNIKFVIHLGDVTSTNADSQWNVASAAHTLLDNAVPYSVTTGNHDYWKKVGDDYKFDRKATLFDNHFGKSRFSNKSWYGDSYGSSNINSYSTFEIGLLKFLVLSLEFAPRDATLAWANDVVENHPGHRVIVATHSYLSHGASYTPVPSDEDPLGASGKEIFDKLIARHSNIFLVVCGHVGDSEFKTATGLKGHVVNQMLVDYQFETPCALSKASSCNAHCRVPGKNTGNGFLRKLVFDPRKNRVDVTTLSVEQGNSKVFPGGKPTLFCSPLFKKGATKDGGNWYASDPNAKDHRYSFSYDMSTVAP